MIHLSAMRVLFVQTHKYTGFLYYHTPVESDRSHNILVCLNCWFVQPL